MEQQINSMIPSEPSAPIEPSINQDNNLIAARALDRMKRSPLCNYMRKQNAPLQTQRE